MTDLFRTVLDMSITGSYVILAVMLARLLLKRAPKKYSLALWGAAAFRLCCPVSFESVLSLFRLPIFNMSAVQTAHTALSSTLDYIPENLNSDRLSTGLAAVNSYISAPQLQPEITVTPVPQTDWLAIAAGAWCAGMAVMAVYSLVSYFMLRRRVAAAIPVEGNVYRSGAVDSPFILGVFRPRIYLPTGLADADREYVLAHERTHLKKGDHILKLFAYCILVLHWFNPLCHIAFRLMAKDMEMRCDEAVLERSPDIRKPYSTTLVSLAVKPGAPLPSPLAFGETGVKTRVQNILRWKKPALWVTVTATVLSILCLVSCAANPVQDETTHPDMNVFGKDYRPYDLQYAYFGYSYYGHYMTGSQAWYRITDDGELYTSSTMTNSAWSHVGTLEEFDLTEENFDAYFSSSHTIDEATIISVFDPSALRQQVVRAWKTEAPYDTDGVISYDTFFYYILQTNRDQVYAAFGMVESDDRTNGNIDKLVLMSPYTGITYDPVLAEGDYVSSRHVYQPPYMSTVMNDDSGYIYSISDGYFNIRFRQTGTFAESFIISDKTWEEFPFTREEWESALFSAAAFLPYDTVKDAQYLDLSSSYALLRTGSEVYVLRIYFGDRGYLQLGNVYTLTSLGSDADPWVIRFNEIEALIKTIASASIASADDCVAACPEEYEALTWSLDRYMVLRYCFDRFMSRSETGIEASVMAQVCRDILINYNEEELADHSTKDGQAWFETLWDKILDTEGGWNTLSGDVLTDAIVNHNRS